MKQLLFSSCIFYAFFLSTSCKKEEPVVKKIPIDSTAIFKKINGNKWLLKQMQHVYLWNEYLPSNPDSTIAQDAFFKKLIYSDDRFSYLGISVESLKEIKEGKINSFGFEFRLGEMKANSDTLIGQITYVWKNSPADIAGLKRGDLFNQINEDYITKHNYQSVIESAIDFGYMNLNLFYKDGSWLASPVKFDVYYEPYKCNPILLDTIYPNNGNAVGYLIYYKFLAAYYGTDPVYNRDLENIFGKFKSSSIKHLILDLRNNMGGHLLAALKLANLIVPNPVNKTFLNLSYNKILNAEMAKEKSYVFIDEPNNIGNQLKELIVLTDRYSASASEMLIYGLKPYMKVIVIGQQTIGKNVSSILLYDTTGNFENVIYPIIANVSNSLGESEYNQSFKPDYEAVNNSMLLSPLGDTKEVVLLKAINLINGNQRKSANSEKCFYKTYSITKEMGSIMN